MNYNSKLAEQIGTGEFIVTGEWMPEATTDTSSMEATIGAVNGLTAINVADTPHGPALSSLAGSMAMIKAGIEPIYQIVTRDRNRIALQSDLLGAVSLGIRNILCLSGHHQALTSCPDSANVYDLDSIQLIAAVKQMRDNGTLIDGTAIENGFPAVIGCVASFCLKPMDLNIIRLEKKVKAGAEFIQTQAVFDVEAFSMWLESAEKAGIAEKTALIASVMPLKNASEAESLREKYMDLYIPDQIVDRLKAAGNDNAQQKEGKNICAEIITQIKKMNGVRGIHVISGGRENDLKEIISDITG